ncbi:MAG: TolC family protein [Vicinamibacterales bacterium]
MPASIALVVGLALAGAQAATPAALRLVPDTPPEPSLALTLDAAIARGLEHNLATLLADAGVDAAAGRRWTALSDLLPQVSADLSGLRQTVNLATFGISLPGFPEIVGPFNVYDARIGVSQSVFDLEAIQGARAEAAALAGSRHTARDARRLVALVVTNLYLEAQAAASRVEAGRAELENSRALHRLAQDLKSAGLVAKIDVLRAEVQMEADEQREIARENDSAKARLALADAIGLSPATQPIVLADTLTYTPATAPALDAALAQARARREDLQAARARLSAAEARRTAASASRLPSVDLHANYGTIGAAIDTARPTYAVSATVSVPLFNGGETHGKVLEARADVARAQAEADALDRRIEFEVQAALLDIAAAERRAEVARHTVELATEQETQARDRFRAGVAGNLELVQAQAMLAGARDAYIAAVTAHHLARAALARAIGVDERDYRRFIAGETP